MHLYATATPAGATTQLLADTRTGLRRPAASPTATAGVPAPSAAPPTVPLAAPRDEFNTTRLLVDATAVSSTLEDLQGAMRMHPGGGKGGLLEEATLDDFALPPEPPALAVPEQPCAQGPAFSGASRAPERCLSYSIPQCYSCTSFACGLGCRTTCSQSKSISCPHAPSERLRLCLDLLAYMTYAITTRHAV